MPLYGQNHSAIRLDKRIPMQPTPRCPNLRQLGRHTAAIPMLREYSLDGWKKRESVSVSTRCVFHQVHFWVCGLRNRDTPRTCLDWMACATKDACSLPFASVWRRHHEMTWLCRLYLGQKKQWAIAARRYRQNKNDSCNSVASFVPRQTRDDPMLNRGCVLGVVGLRRGGGGGLSCPVSWSQRVEHDGKIYARRTKMDKI